jgi:hypothetical protein
MGVRRRGGASRASPRPRRGEGVNTYPRTSRVRVDASRVSGHSGGPLLRARALGSDGPFTVRAGPDYAEVIDAILSTRLLNTRAAPFSFM